MMKRNLYKNGKLVVHRSGEQLVNALLNDTLTDEELEFVPSSDVFYKELYNAIVWKKTN